MHRVQQVLHITAVGGSLQRRQKHRPHAAEDEKTHPRLFGPGPPFVLFLEINEGVNGEAQLGD